LENKRALLVTNSVLFDIQNNKNEQPKITKYTESSKCISHVPFDIITCVDCKFRETIKIKTDATSAVKLKWTAQMPQGTN
jgi:hypothetical protein